MPVYKNIGCVFSNKCVGNPSVNSLLKRYNLINLQEKYNEKIDLLVVIGGDGLMLHSLHNYVLDGDIPVYGMNLGTVGFLLNKYSENNLLERIYNAIPTKLALLTMEAIDIYNQLKTSIAINEISIFRNTHQAANLKIYINNKLKMEKLVADGILLSTPAGSTAYNFSAGGSILPLSSNVLSLKTINPFRPRKWYGAILPSNSLVEIEVISPQARSVTVVSDYTEFHNISKLKMKKDLQRTITLLFDPEHDLEEKIITEQFLL